jgi:hypothetical protein
LHELGLLGWRAGAELAEEIDGGGQGELGGAEAGDEIAATDAAGFFKSFEDVVDSAEAAGNVFGGDGFAGEDAVAVEELEREGVADFGGGGSWGLRGLGRFLAFPSLRSETWGTRVRAGRDSAIRALVRADR